MAFTTIELRGKPWVVCDPAAPHEIDDFVERAGKVPARITTRVALPDEAAKLEAERALTSMRGGKIERVFGVAL